MNSIRGTFLHPMVVQHGLNNGSCEHVTEDTVRWALEKLEKRGQLKRRQQFGIRGKIGWHYSGLEKGDIDGNKV